MKKFKYTKHLQLLLVLSLFLLIIGCGSSTDTLLKNSLDTMNSDVNSYKFTGSTTMDMGAIQGSGTIAYEGLYQAPGQMYMKMDMGIMDQSQSMEIYIDEKDKVFTRVGGTEWVPYLAPPNLSNFHQPGLTLNGVYILKTLKSILGETKDAGTEQVNSRQTTVIEVSADSSKLKDTLTNKLLKNSRLSPEETDTISKLVKNMEITQNYRVYIDPETEYIMKLNLKQETDLLIDEQEATIITDMEFNYFDFNKPVILPDLSSE